MIGTDPKLGEILTDAYGMTLYFSAKDTAESSACTGGRGANWPPLTVSGTPTAPSGATGTLATITRDDRRDAGQGVGGVWTVAIP